MSLHFVFALLLVALALASASASFAASTVSGRVVAVIDGDTVLFRPDSALRGRAFMKLRLRGIDAPETRQPHGDTATRALEALARGRDAQAQIEGRDRYDRPLAVLVVAGRDLNVALVEAGHAWASRWQPDPALIETETRARRAGLGLWAVPDPQPPWRWRRAHPNQ